MDYTNLESLGDNRAAWKQELPPSLKNGELALKETPVEKRKKRKESSLSNAHLTDDYVYLPGMQPPPQVTHRTEHPHQKMLICRLDGYIHSLTRLTDVNE